jgi:AsmA protein
MNKYIKYTFYAIAGFAVLFVGAISVVVFTVDPNSFKPMIVEMVKAKKQRTLTLTGDIKLTLFPKLGLDLGKAALSEHKGDKDFAAVDRLRLGVSWLPLLRNELLVEQVIVDGLHARLVRYPDGSTNFDDLMKKEEASEIKFDIDKVKITSAALDFDDQQAKRKLALSEINITTRRLKNNVPTEIAGTFNLLSDNPKLKLQNRIDSVLKFDLDHKRYTLDALSFESIGEAVGITDFKFGFGGSADINLDTLYIDAKNIGAELRGMYGADRIELKLDAPQLQLTKDKASSSKITLDAKLQRPSGNVRVAAVLTALSGNAQTFKADAFTVEVSGIQSGNAINGKLSSLVSGNLENLQFDLTKIAANVTVTNAKLPNGGFKADLAGDAGASVKQEYLHFNGALHMDESHIKAKLAMQGFAQPKYNFDVDIDQLDADRYMASKPAAQAASQPSGAEKPLDLSALKQLNATGSLHIGSLKFSDVKTNNLHIDLKAANGHLDAAPISANLYQGSLAGSINVNAGATPQFTLKQKFSNVSVGPLIKDAINKDIVEGHGNINLDISAQGNTVSAMKKNLHGSAGLVLNDGAIKGINLAATLRNAKAKLGALKGQQTQAANQQEKTDFTELKANFAINHGVAHNDDLSAKSPLLRLGGNGDIDLGNNSMNYLAKATVVGSLEGQGGADSLKGLSVPVRVSGPFEALKYNLDFNAMVGEVAKAKIEQKTEEVKSKLGEQLKSGLNGLFK